MDVRRIKLESGASFKIRDSHIGFLTAVLCDSYNIFLISLTLPRNGTILGKPYAILFPAILCASSYHDKRFTLQ